MKTIAGMAATVQHTCTQRNRSALITLITSASLGLCARCHQACCQVITKRQTNEQLAVTLGTCKSM